MPDDDLLSVPALLSVSAELKSIFIFQIVSCCGLVFLHMATNHFLDQMTDVTDNLKRYTLYQVIYQCLSTSGINQDRKFEESGASLETSTTAVRVDS